MLTGVSTSIFGFLMAHIFEWTVHINHFEGKAVVELIKLMTPILTYVVMDL